MICPLAIFLLVTLLTLSSADASSYFYISTDNYASGDDNITFNINFHTDENVIVDGYALEFGYDTSELDYKEHEIFNVFDEVGKNFWGPLEYSEEDGVVDNFNAESQFEVESPNASPGDYVLGSITFDIVNPTMNGSAELSDFYVDFEDVMFGFSINNQDYWNDSPDLHNYFPEYTIDIVPSAVPVPSALLLMGTGILGLAGLKRKFT